MTRYGYTRTSTKDKQDDDLQRRALVEAGVDEKHIHSDQVSGSKAARTRTGWSALDALLQDGDELVVWRIDRIGRSMIDIINTVHDLLARGVSIRSVSDGIDPSTREGRMQLNLMATFAEYERELIQERVQAGVDAAKARGVKFGRPAPDAKMVARNLRTVQHLIDAEGLGVVEAAKTVGWSKATYYRHRAAAGP
ncbi:recombinase family protein [Enemella evansiae]|uniref:Invertase n=1 Tax=Enemella evansiae TaxID=2016499 RepID=A0A255GW54_9ACTN|nr:recombinase family protein [Enemella evansiae]OYO14038.1 invertase [Enemella evansiae]OYO17524.1 invertase [Enemella evansiae]TDO89547.1 DNA invertase Pin-like site-specific DNA recombinase [Enemella evansiae]